VSTWILPPLASFGLAVSLHGISLRTPLRIDAVRQFLLIGIPLGGGLLVLSIAIFGFTSYALASVLLYAFLCELYIFCFTLVLSSVSVTLLITLRRGPLAASALKVAYDPHEMVELRLTRLIKQGLIVQKGDQTAVTAAGMRLHRAFAALQRFFRHETE
jgi:hypothetical protein